MRCSWGSHPSRACNRPPTWHVAPNFRGSSIGGTFTVCPLHRSAFAQMLLRRDATDVAYHRLTPACRHPERRWADGGCTVATVPIYVPWPADR